MKLDLSSVAVAATVALFAGCSSLQAITSGQVGCAERDITITEEDTGWAARTWTAECNGKTYFCSAITGGQNSGGQVSCKEATETAPVAPPPAPEAVAPAPTPVAPTPVAPAPAPAPAPVAPAALPQQSPSPTSGSGCQYDTQCKGDRICERGACVNPHAVAPAQPADSTE